MLDGDGTQSFSKSARPSPAEIQASGKSIQQLAAEADAAAEFEIAELFDQIGAANDADE